MQCTSDINNYDRYVRVSMFRFVRSHFTFIRWIRSPLLLSLVNFVLFSTTNLPTKLSDVCLTGNLSDTRTAVTFLNERSPHAHFSFITYVSRSKHVVGFEFESVKKIFMNFIQKNLKF